MRRSGAALVLGLLLTFVAVSCSRAQQEKALADAQSRVNSYCAARQKLLAALGADGLGEAGAGP